MNIKQYLLFYPQYKNLSIHEIQKNYYDDLEKGNAVSIETFFKKYKTFNLEECILEYPEIKEFTMIDILLFWNNKKIVEESVIEEPVVEETGVEETVVEESFVEETVVEETVIEENVVEETVFEETVVENNKLKLAHVFIHMFEIGGGERYLSKFSEHNSIFEETLFIKNDVSFKYFKYNCNVIFYEDYNHLNNLLKDYDIILDHQLYWFEKNISEIVFENIYDKIIQITHGVPIHFEDITLRKIKYSIELYNEKNSHISWNNHIKLYHNIGVPIIENNGPIDSNFNVNNINIAIVGRINPEKVPPLFLKKIRENKKYIFNFYGPIDENYKKIKNHKNINYHGIILPENIDQIYLNNNILLHPSISEAGATVILEAMSYGLPVVARNISGIQNSVGPKNIKYLFNNEDEIFDKIELITRENYKNISQNNILKIKEYNDEKIVYPNLINDIYSLYLIENKSETRIPNIIHYVFGLEKQTEEFLFVYYLSILSNILINKPIIIYFHYQYLPYGKWWNKIVPYLKLNYIICDNLKWGDKKIIKTAHKADKIRLDILYKYGGIYMDIDTISYRPYNHLLNNYDFVIGIQELDFYLDKRKNRDCIPVLYCNAILFSTKNSVFIKKWIQKYPKYFLSNGWCEASVHLTYKIYEGLQEDDKNNVLLLNQNTFYYPLYKEVHKIFEGDEEINEDLITLHWWNSESKEYIKNICGFEWASDDNNCLYSKLIKNIKEKI
jgi:glycosyltransferase involved in cell wall biosynthesis